MEFDLENSGNSMIQHLRTGGFARSEKEIILC